MKNYALKYVFSEHKKCIGVHHSKKYNQMNKKNVFMKSEL